MADTRRPGSRVVYRCHGCAYEFALGTAGVTPCPRCGCIGGHERVGTLRGARAGDGDDSGGGPADGGP